MAWRLAHEASVKLGLQTLPNAFLTDAIEPSDAVLELGCGTGEVIGSVSAKRRVGVDYDEEKLRIAKMRFPEVEFVTSDLRSFADQDFDVLILSHVLEHLDDPSSAFRSAPNFRQIYVEVPDLEADRLNRLRVTRKRSLSYTDADHVFEFNREEIEGLFREFGLEIVDREFRFGVMRYWLRCTA